MVRCLANPQYGINIHNFAHKCNKIAIMIYMKVTSRRVINPADIRSLGSRRFRCPTTASEFVIDIVCFSDRI